MRYILSVMALIFITLSSSANQESRKDFHYNGKREAARSLARDVRLAREADRTPIDGVQYKILPETILILDGKVVTKEQIPLGAIAIRSIVSNARRVILFIEMISPPIDKKKP